MRKADTKGRWRTYYKTRKAKLVIPKRTFKTKERAAKHANREYGSKKSIVNYGHFKNPKKSKSPKRRGTKGRKR